MKSVNMRSTKPDRYAQAPQQQPHELSAQQPHAWPLSPCEDPHVLIAMRPTRAMVREETGMDLRSMIGSTRNGRFSVRSSRLDRAAHCSVGFSQTRDMVVAVFFLPTSRRQRCLGRIF